MTTSRGKSAVVFAIHLVIVIATALPVLLYFYQEHLPGRKLALTGEPVVYSCIAIIVGSALLCGHNWARELWTWACFVLGVLGVACAAFVYLFGVNRGGFLFFALLALFYLASAGFLKFPTVMLRFLTPSEEDNP
ncbi:MAG: hypothetical protein HC897_19340 [Thermoanaerobaculia bacterium]|nr:hypothetical protein [Thermoanaerobaculia bacterium]